MCVVSVLSSDRIQQSMMCPLQNETQNHLLFDRENENETNCCIIITVPVRMLSAILCTLHGIYNTLSISSIEHWTICYLTCEIMIVMIIFVHGPFMRNRQSLIKLFLCAEFIQSFFFSFFLIQTLNIGNLVYILWVNVFVHTRAILRRNNEKFCPPSEQLTFEFEYCLILGHHKDVEGVWWEKNQSSCWITLDIFPTRSSKLRQNQQSWQF